MTDSIEPNPGLPPGQETSRRRRPLPAAVAASDGGAAGDPALFPAVFAQIPAILAPPRSEKAGGATAQDAGSGKQDPPVRIGHMADAPLRDVAGIAAVLGERWPGVTQAPPGSSAPATPATAVAATAVADPSWPVPSHAIPAIRQPGEVSAAVPPRAPFSIADNVRPDETPLLASSKVFSAPLSAPAARGTGAELQATTDQTPAPALATVRVSPSPLMPPELAPSLDRPMPVPTRMVASEQAQSLATIAGTGEPGVLAASGQTAPAAPGTVTALQAPLQAPAPQPASAEAVMAQVTSQLSPAGRSEMTIRLDPPELGHVRIGLTVSDGHIAAVVSVERPDVESMLRRHAGQLTQALQTAGYGEVDLEFRRDEAPQDRHPPHSGQPGAMKTGGSAQVAIEEFPPATGSGWVRLDAGLDLRL